MDSYSYFVFVKCNGPKAKLLSIDKKKIDKKYMNSNVIPLDTKFYIFRMGRFFFSIIFVIMQQL